MIWSSRCTDVVALAVVKGVLNKLLACGVKPEKVIISPKRA